MRDWYHLNEARESWLFLLLNEGEESQLNRWAFGIGNISHMVRTGEQSCQDFQTEAALLDCLRRDLQIHHDEPPLLITPCAETLAFLRQRLLVQQAEEQLSFRGFRHVAVREVIDAHFGGEVPTTSAGQSSHIPHEERPLVWSANSADIMSLWELWKDLVPFVPVEALAGEAL